jgi:uncharacterized protein (TIGR02588 family)
MIAKQGQENIPAAEWVVAGIGVLLVAAIMIMLLIDATQADESPPAIAVSVDTTVALAQSHLVEITAKNESGQAAAAVRVEGVLADASGRAVERSESTVDYLPAHSKRQMGLYFSHKPGDYRLTVRAVSYQHP